MSLSYQRIQYEQLTDTERDRILEMLNLGLSKFAFAMYGGIFGNIILLYVEQLTQVYEHAEKVMIHTIAKHST